MLAAAGAVVLRLYAPMEDRGVWGRLGLPDRATGAPWEPIAVFLDDGSRIDLAPGYILDVRKVWVEGRPSNYCVVYHAPPLPS